VGELLSRYKCRKNRPGPGLIFPLVERGSETADSGREGTEAAELALAYEALEPDTKGLKLVEEGVTMDGNEDEVVAVTGGVKLGSEGVMGLVMLDAAGSWVPPRTNSSWLPSSAISGEAVERGVVASGKGGPLVILYKRTR
jgi:hypothetical protein